MLSEKVCSINTKVDLSDIFIHSYNMLSSKHVTVKTNLAIVSVDHLW